MPQLVAEEAGQGGDTPSASEDNGSFVEPEWLKKSKANGKNMNLFKTIGEQKCKFLSPSIGFFCISCEKNGLCLRRPTRCSSWSCVDAFNLVRMATSATTIVAVPTLSQF